MFMCVCLIYTSHEIKTKQYEWWWKQMIGYTNLNQLRQHPCKVNIYAFKHVCGLLRDWGSVWFEEPLTGFICVCCVFLSVDWECCDVLWFLTLNDPTSLFSVSGVDSAPSYKSKCMFVSLWSLSLSLVLSRCVSSYSRCSWMWVWPLKGSLLMHFHKSCQVHFM